MGSPATSTQRPGPGTTKIPAGSQAWEGEQNVTKCKGERKKDRVWFPPRQFLRVTAVLRRKRESLAQLNFFPWSCSTAFYALPRLLEADNKKNTFYSSYLFFIVCLWYWISHPHFWASGRLWYLTVYAVGTIASDFNARCIPKYDTGNHVGVCKKQLFFSGEHNRIRF